MPRFIGTRVGGGRHGALIPQFKRPEDKAPMRGSNDEIIAFLLINTWALSTGRTLRSDVPPRDLSEQELIDFWADPENILQNGETARELPEPPQAAL